MCVCVAVCQRVTATVGPSRLALNGRSPVATVPFPRSSSSARRIRPRLPYNDPHPQRFVSCRKGELPVEQEPERERERQRHPLHYCRSLHPPSPLLRPLHSVQGRCSSHTSAAHIILSCDAVSARRLRPQAQRKADRGRVTKALQNPGLHSSRPVSRPPPLPPVLPPLFQRQGRRRGRRWRSGERRETHTHTGRGASRRRPRAVFGE